MKPRRAFGFTVVGAIAVGAVTTFLMHEGMMASSEAVETVALIEIFLSTFNVVVLSTLTGSYFRMYREMPNPMSRGLLIFSLALTLYAVTSSPVTHYLAGIKLISIGALTFIPEVFVAAGSLTLLYENFR